MGNSYKKVNAIEDFSKINFKGSNKSLEDLRKWEKDLENLDMIFCLV